MKFLRRTSNRMLADLNRGKNRKLRHRAAKANHNRALAGHRQSRRRTLRHQDDQQQRRMGEDVSDPEVVDSIKLLAETEGVFTETAGGVTVGWRASSIARVDLAR